MTAAAEHITMDRVSSTSRSFMPVVANSLSLAIANPPPISLLSTLKLKAYGVPGWGGRFGIMPQYKKK